MASKAETCPQCGNETLSILPGAKRATCSLCHFSPPDKDAPVTPPFQGHVHDRSAFRRKKSINLSTPLLLLLLVVAGYFGYQSWNQEPEELVGFRTLERSYAKVNHLITAEALKTADSRAQLRHKIRREKAVIAHMQVSTCLNHPRVYLTNAYGMILKSLEKEHTYINNIRQVIALSSKYINGALECREKFAPDQYTSLQLYADYPGAAKALEQ